MPYQCLRANSASNAASRIARNNGVTFSKLTVSDPMRASSSSALLTLPARKKIHVKQTKWYVPAMASARFRGLAGCLGLPRHAHQRRGAGSGAAGRRAQQAKV